MSMELQTQAAAFAEKWQGKGYEKGETQLFYRDLFDIFAVPVERVAVFEHAVKRLGKGSGYIDLFWKGRLLVEQKSAGSSLARAKEQAFEYCEDLSDAEHPRYVLLSDFQTFELYDLRDGQEAKFSLKDLPKHIHKLAFIAGDDKTDLTEQEKVTIKAAELVGDLHDALEAVGYTGHDLERLLVRIVFCLFADDTGIFERDAFQNLIEKGTAENGSDVGSTMSLLFQALNTPDEARQSSLDERLAKFPYINGELFSEGLRIPAFDSGMRQRLIAA